MSASVAHLSIHKVEKILIFFFQLLVFLLQLADQIFLSVSGLLRIDLVLYSLSLFVTQLRIFECFVPFIYLLLSLFQVFIDFGLLVLVIFVSSFLDSFVGIVMSGLLLRISQTLGLLIRY